MSLHTEIPDETYNDEIVCFLAERYHTTPHQILQRFWEQNGNVIDTSNAAFQLEENEMIMLRDLTERIHP